MKSTVTEATVRKVSLELNSKPPSRSNKLAHSRVSMCYSANLKKRADAIQVQKNIFDQQYPRSQAGDKVVNDIHKKQSLHPKIKKQPKPLAITKISINQKKNHPQSFQIMVKNIHRQDKEKRPQTSKITQQKLLPNYDTIKTLQIEQKQESNFIDVDFKNEKMMKGFQNSTMQNYNGRVTEQEKNSRNKTENTQMMTAPSNSNLLSTTKISKFQQKETYKTNQINFSQHFKNVEEGSTLFPTCRKMAISNVNKFYELCIEDIRNLQERKKKIKQQRQEKEKQQKIQQIAEETLRKNYSASINKNRGVSTQTSSKIIGHGKNPEPNKMAKLMAKSIMGNKLQTQESNIWLQIKNGIDDEEQLGYALCSKKQILERSNLTAPFKKNIGSRNLLKKCSTDVHRNDDQQCLYSSPTRMSRTKSMKSHKNNVHQGFHNFHEDAPLDAWDTLQQNFDSSSHLHQNQYNL